MVEFLFYLFNFFIIIINFFWYLLLFRKDTKNIFIIIFFFIYLIYIHISPSIVSGFNNKYDQYFWVQLIFFIFFELPIYLLVNNKYRNIPIISLKYKNSALTKYIVFLGLILLPIFNYYILWNNNFLYKRLGDETIDILQNFNFFERLIVKFFDFFSLILPSLLFYSYIKFNKNKFLCLYWIISSSILFIINSKQNMILLVLILSSIYIFLNGFNFKIKYLFFILLSFYVLKITNDLRYNLTFDKNGINVDYDFLNPFTEKKVVYEENDIFYFRLNGVDLASDFYRVNGFFNFDADYFKHIYYMTIDPIIGDGNYMQLAKSNAYTTTKILLQRKYLGINTTDNYSCVLTDIFGAFGFIGVFVLSLLFSFIFLISKLLLSSKSNIYVILGIFSSIAFINFEMDFFTNLFNFLILFLPILFLGNFISKQS